MRLIKGENDLETLHPELAKEWDCEANYPLRPDQVTSGSEKEVMWKCKLGHSYPAKIYNRTRNNGTKCPYCAGKKVLAGFNDLLSQYPEIAAEWHPTKNGDLQPNQVTTGSEKEVVWKCKLGHSYPAKIYNRTGNNRRECPYCAGRKAWPGFNDLLSQYPEIAAEWHPTKNGDLRPDQVVAGSEKKVWWGCEKGHSYPACIIKRTKRGDGCPYCAGKKVWAGFNDLLSQYPEIAAEWHPTKNGDLRPDQVVAGSCEKVWWKCKKGHSYPARIYSRTKDGTGCPYCAGEKAWLGFNDLLSQYPEIAAEWHLTKNGDLRPDQVVAGSCEKVWWECEKGHSYLSRISERTKRGRGCPYCAGRKVWAGFNDLLSQYPEIAVEWHPTKNGDLRPDQVVAGSENKVWWECEKGHSYPARIFSRTRNGSGCPCCIGRKAWVGLNDLLSQYPEIAAEWHPTKNGDLRPDQVVAGSEKKVWWECEKGHSYPSRISERTKRGNGCPYCVGKKAWPGFNDLESKFPDIVRDFWDYSKNNKKPCEYTVFSTSMVYWRCHKCGHSFRRRIGSQVLSGKCEKCK